MAEKLHYHVPFTGLRSISRSIHTVAQQLSRLLGQLPEMIYYQNKEGIAVNLYETRHEFQARRAEVQLIQTTEYPSSGTVKIEVKPPPVNFRLSLRIPAGAPRRWSWSKANRHKRSRVTIPRHQPDLATRRCGGIAHAAALALGQGTDVAGRAVWR